MELLDIQTRMKKILLSSRHGIESNLKKIMNRNKNNQNLYMRALEMILTLPSETLMNLRKKNNQML